MDIDVKNKWITALRSGRYLQGGGALRAKGQAGDDAGGEEATDKFCCLGVLCDVVGVEWKRGDTGPLVKAVHGLNEEISYPPASLRDEIGLTGVQAEKLANLNDNEEYSFEQIADWVEENL